MQIYKWRQGVGLFQAIMIILLISGMMIIVLKYASISAKHTRNSFVREQAELFLNSAIEQTLLEISDYNRSDAGGSCLSTSSIKSVSKKGVTYSANVNIIKYYLQDGSDDLDYCQNTDPNLGVAIGDGDGESHGMALLEVEVNATSNGVILARIIQRTLQQP